MGQSPNSDECNQDGIGIPFLQGNAEFGKRSPVAKNYCEHPKKIACKGEYLLSVRAPVGALNYADQIYGIGRGLCSIAKNQKICSEYLWWLISVIKTELDSVSTGSTFEAVSAEQVGNSSLFLPPVSEQIKIARFLTRETAKIDALIEKQQRLIDLLKEKRQAVISHAVTKGLNPNAPMKDSGVEWLGEVPAHWVVSRVKDVTTKIIDGPHFSPSYVDDGYMFLSARNIKVDRWSLSDAKYISEENFREFNKRIKPEKGDVLLTKGGTTGVARAVDLDFDFQVWVHIAVLKTVKSKIDHFFLAHSLNGKSCYEQSQLSTYGATNNDLGLSRIANIVLAAPPLEEQHAICHFINDKCSKLDRLISNSLVSIELMQERRTALISAAVTGKIDVRDWQAAA